MTSPFLQPIVHRLARPVLRMKIACGMHAKVPRDAAFARYYRLLVREFAHEERGLRVESRQTLDERDDAPGTLAIRLEDRDCCDWMPGDLLLVRWENAPDRVHAVREALPPREVPLRTVRHGIPLNPATYCRVDPETFLREVIDLSVPLPDPLTWDALNRLQPRIKPRIYTAAAVGPRGTGCGIELIVSGVREGRASSYLNRMPVDGIVHAHRLPHPHRLPCAHGHAGPGLCVVTGSAIAGVLAHLRSGHALPPIWLIWGVRNRDRLYYGEELEAWVRAGRLTRLDVVESRPSAGDAGRRVQTHVAEQRANVASFLGQRGWCYVSGQHGMAEATTNELRAIFGTHVMGDWEKDLRLVVSASG